MGAAVNTKILTIYYFVDGTNDRQQKIQKFELKDMGLELCQKTWNKIFIYILEGETG